MYGGGDGGNLVTSSLSTILHTSLVSASYRGIPGDGQTNDSAHRHTSSHATPKFSFEKHTSYLLLTLSELCIQFLC